jgi:hypothetical protein
MMFEVHPAADPWPMLPEDELIEMAKSIAEVGLLEPLVLTPDGLLLDGRNRLDACVRAGVMPTTIVYDGDPVAFVLARNAHRRHMSQGQRATAVWLTASLNDSRPVAASIAAAAHVDPSHMTRAKVVAEQRPDLLPAITNGDIELHVAYDIARGANKPPPEVSTIRRFIAGWTTFAALDSRPDRDAILAALSDDERRTLNDIRRLLR